MVEKAMGYSENLRLVILRVAKHLPRNDERIILSVTPGSLGDASFVGTQDRCAPQNDRYKAVVIS
jgi:hypothetical protein